MPGLEEVEATISKCRKQRPKLLFNAWRAARERNQSAFEDAFMKALNHFGKYFNPEEEPYNFCTPFEWIAPHHSVVALAARRYGMKLPKLTPKQDAWIIRRETIGLPVE